MSQQKSNKKWQVILNGMTFVGLGVLIVFSYDQIGETLHNLSDVMWWILLFMIVWQLLNYHSYTGLYRNLYSILGNKIAYWPMYKAAVELNFVNHVFPSAGVAGFSYFAFRMKQEGAPASKSTLIQMMRFVLVFISFQILLFCGVVALAMEGKANNFTILVAGSIGTALAIGTLLAMYVAGSKTRINSFTVGLTRLLNKLISYVRPKHPETISVEWVRNLFLELHEDYMVLRRNIGGLKKPFFYSFCANFTEVATIYMVFLAFGQPVNIGAVILAYAVANFAGLISILPGGIGVYEALMAGVLAVAGVPPSIGVPATVMYRILSMAIQLPPGYYFYHKSIAKFGIDKDTAS